MPRNARKQSASGIYHVMVRGNEKKDIFFDNEDRKRFLCILKKVKEEGKHILFAYCLMNNHVHMLVREGGESVQRMMKRIGICYASYFNKKYDRVGHLFQDRFKSEAVGDDRYILAVSRYIHNNPLKAGMVEKQKDYEWSSFNAYINDDSKSDSLIDRNFLLSMFSDNSDIAIKLFIDFSNKPDDNFIDIDENKTIDQRNADKDLECRLLIVLNKHGFGLDDLKMCKDKQLRNYILNDIKQNINISIRNLSDITGISRDIIFRA